MDHKPKLKYKTTKKNFLNLKKKPYKLQEDSKGENLDNLGFGDDFLDMTPMA